MKSESEIETGLEIFNLASAVDEAARKWGERVVLHHYESDGKVSYKEVAHMSNRVGNALRDLGVEIENRVALLMDDCPEWVYVLFGVLKIGAVLTPLNTLLTEKDYAYFLADSRAKVLFVGAPLFDKIKSLVPSLPYLRQVVVSDRGNFSEGEGRVVSWDTFIRDASGELEIEPTLSNDVALFAYTSGSTGRPRAIMHSHRNILLGSSEFQKVKGVGEGHIQFHIAKSYFLITLSGLVSAFNNGSSMVLLSGRPTASMVLEVIARYRPTFLVAPPTILARMVDAAEEKPDLGDLSSVLYIFCTGEALSPELFKRFQETFGKTPYNCWGAQELCSAPLSWQFGEEVPLEKVGSNGKSPCLGAKVKIVDEFGKEVPNGVAGEIMFKTETQFLGYWHEPEETANKIHEGWYKPGDSFVRDEEGYYWYLGRLDDMVKVGGRPIFPVEVEHTVARHPAVLENAVIPVQNDYGLTELQAFVILKQGYRSSPELATQIQSYVKEHLAPYKRPHRVEFVPDLPKTATGKIQRFRLREQAIGNHKKSEE